MAGSFTGVELPDVQVLKQLARDQLILQLESMTGQKDLVLEADLMKPLDHIAGATLLKQHGVDKIFKLEPAKTLPGCEQRIYLVRPLVTSIKFVADQINADKAAGQKRKYRILYVPRRLHVCDLVLEKEGVFGYVTTDEFQLDFIPLDRDILSLQMPDFFTSFFLDGDQTWIHTAARSLVGLQQVFGLIPNVYKIGPCAQKVHELMNVFFEFQGEPQQLKGEIGHLFLIDRSIDFVTPLCSQVTYEGLLDDIFHINTGFIEFGEEVTGREQPMKLLLNSADSVYEEIRNRHFSNVFSYLSATAKQLQSGYDKRHTMTSVQEMKEFVANDLKGLKQQHKSLSLHIGACEVIIKKKTVGDFEDILRTEHCLLEGIDWKDSINYIEELINRQGCTLNPYLSATALRLLCLLSLTLGGLSSQTYKSLRTQYLQSYGSEHLITFSQLRRLGLLQESEPASNASKQLSKVAAITNIPRSSNFRSLCKKLQLIPKSAEEVNLKNPNDMSYVYSGAYTPLCCRLVEQILDRDGFVGLDDVIRLLPGNPSASCKAKSARGKGGTGTGLQEPSTRVAMVYFLGGCTYSEITALRFLGRLKGYKFLIGTTSILNSNSLVEMAMQPMK